MTTRNSQSRPSTRLSYITLGITCAAMTLISCSSSEDSAAPDLDALARNATPNTARADAGNCADTGTYPTSPTVDLLNGLLQKGLDPNVPSADKVALVQGTAGDPDFLNRTGAALREAGFVSDIRSVTDYCNGTANADATLTIYGQESDSQVPLVAEEGIWKLDKNWACGLAASLQQSSPICT